MLTGVSAAVARNTAEGRLEDNLISLAKIGVHAKKRCSGRKNQRRFRLSVPHPGAL